jgi:hypothetical protein
LEQGLDDPAHVKKLLKCSKTLGKLALALVGSGAKTVRRVSMPASPASR